MDKSKLELNISAEGGPSCATCPYKLGYVKYTVNPCLGCPHKKSAAVRGLTSFMENAAAVFKGEKSLAEAAADTLKDTVR
ncbi:hypothetical protein IJT93_07005 [bacterium]|nr:hypothetical protein [bacterium]